MQPYFFPYAGYFRLFAQADEFVLFDDAQFPRRGRVHRCQVPGPDGGEEWLTLPLAHQPQRTAIADLRFADDIASSWPPRLARLPWFAGGEGPNAGAVRDFLAAPRGPVVDFLESGLRLVLDVLGLPARIRRSSTLGVDPALRGSERIVALCRAAGGDVYLNSPGGRGLYDAAEFAAQGIALEFLPDYAGSHRHLLPALMTLPGSALRADVLSAALP